MASIRFNLKPKGETVQIRAVLEHNSQPPKFKNLGFTIPPTKKDGAYKYWDGAKYRAKLVDNAFDINKRIDDWKAIFNAYVKKCEDTGEDFDLQTAKDLLPLNNTGVASKPKSNLSFIEAAKNNRAANDQLRKWGTDKQYKSFIEDIAAYQVHIGKTIFLRDIDYNFYKLFGSWLVAERGNINSTVNRKISRIITIMKDCYPKLISTDDWKRRYTFKHTDTESRFALLPEEYEVIIKHKCKTKHQQKVLDAFIFSCETTLRHSDVVQLLPVHKKVMEVKGREVHYLHLSQIKTTNPNRTVLTDLALKIWNKYNEEPVFKIGSSQAAGNILRVIFKDAGLDRPCEIVKEKGSVVTREIKPLHKIISYHMSRNTAITFQLSYLPPAIVMKNAAIKKMETLMGYYKDDSTSRYLLTLDKMNR